MFLIYTYSMLDLGQRLPMIPLERCKLPWRRANPYLSFIEIPSGMPAENPGKSPFSTGKLTISTAILVVCNSYDQRHRDHRSLANSKHFWPFLRAKPARLQYIYTEEIPSAPLQQLGDLICLGSLVSTMWSRCSYVRLCPMLSSISDFMIVPNSDEVDLISSEKNLFLVIFSFLPCYILVIAGEYQEVLISVPKWERSVDRIPSYSKHYRQRISNRSQIIGLQGTLSPHRNPIIICTVCKLYIFIYI